MLRGSSHKSHRTSLRGIRFVVPCSGKQHLCNLVYREVIIHSLVGLQSCTPCCHFGLCPLIIAESYFQALVSQPTSLPWNAGSSNCLAGSPVNWGLLLHLHCLQMLLINISTLLTPMSLQCRTQSMRLFLLRVPEKWEVQLFQCYYHTIVKRTVYAFMLSLAIFLAFTKRVKFKSSPKGNFYHHPSHISV